MGIVSFSLSASRTTPSKSSAVATPSLSPLPFSPTSVRQAVKALAVWLKPLAVVSHAARRTLTKPAPRHQAQLDLPFVVKATCHRPAISKPAASTCKAPVVSRLKVVREFDSSMKPSLAGRMMISGRMADVCAELERMTQLESATH